MVEESCRIGCSSDAKGCVVPRPLGGECLRQAAIRLPGGYIRFFANDSVSDGPLQPSCHPRDCLALHTLLGSRTNGCILIPCRASVRSPIMRNMSFALSCIAPEMHRACSTWRQCCASVSEGAIFLQWYITHMGYFPARHGCVAAAGAGGARSAGERASACPGRPPLAAPATDGKAAGECGGGRGSHAGTPWWATQPLRRAQPLRLHQSLRHSIIRLLRTSLLLYLLSQSRAGIVVMPMLSCAASVDELIRLRPTHSQCVRHWAGH